jgi:large subunit ribosomal protein L5e
MPYIKVVKTKSYFKRFQVQFKRRREGKTDYYARKRLTLQDKNKYNSPKYRLVVRKTNKDIICQIAYATLKCDNILSAAYSHELGKYGVKAGLKNYSAAYATGLLVARRVLTKLQMADKYTGQTKAEAIGKYYAVEGSEGERRPFYVILDVGLNRTTTGAKIFAAMKGAADGGLFIPHSDSMKQFPGYNKDSGKFDSRVLRKYIFGGHVADYMKKLREEDGESYKRQFADYIKAGVEPEHIEAMWTKAHAEIRKNPSHTPVKKQEKVTHKKNYKPKKKNLKQRKDRIKQKLAALQKAAEVQ